MESYPLPLEEQINPVIEEGVTRPAVWIVPHDGSREEFRVVELVKRHNATHAYQLIEGIEPRPLEHGGAIWGHVYVGVVLPRRLEDLLYLEPTPEAWSGRSPSTTGPPTIPLQRVVIKKLHKLVVDQDVQNGSAENPYREIMRMQEVGDEHHVLPCIEALQDDRFLYIVTKYCDHGSLADVCPLPAPWMSPEMSTESQARLIFKQMLEDVEYLHQRDICHRDIDPGNFLVGESGRVITNDLAMSFRMPPGGIVSHPSQFGKPPYWLPEISSRIPYDAKQSDIWACVVTLFNMLTGLPLYRHPVPHDVMFVYTIMAGGLSRDHMDNETAMEVMSEVNGTQDFDLLSSARQSIQALSPQVRELFEHSLSLHPNERWTLDDIRRCQWMNMPL